MMFIKLIIFLTTVFLVGFSSLLEIELPHGKIRGHYLKSSNGNIYRAYQEIPYASPPIGENRFKEPVEPQRWSGVLNASSNNKICMQDRKPRGNLIMSEDCLYLNVYSPNDNTQLYPVLFWIHGGKFIRESGVIDYYSPKYLIDYNIVVVSINYRLGPFGFLSTSDGVIPGNLGIKDQLLALKWVHQNIYLFGGDKKQITVLGHSAGGISASYLQVSELSKGLVKSYIIESGSSLCQITFRLDPDYYAFRMGQAINENFNSKNTTDLLNVLKNATAEDILNAFDSDDTYNIESDRVWSPTLEKYPSETAIITTYTIKKYEEGNFQQVPMLIGVAGEDAFNLVSGMDVFPKKAKEYDQNPSLLFNHKIKIRDGFLNEARQEYKNIYTPGTFEEDNNSFIKYLGSRIFGLPAIHTAVLSSEYVPVYLYQFSYKGPLGGGPEGVTTAGHGESLHYIFGNPDKGDNITVNDELTRRRILKIITNFVKYQNPVVEKDEMWQSIEWPKVKKNNLKYLDINSILIVKKNPMYYKEVNGMYKKYVVEPYIAYL